MLKMYEGHLMKGPPEVEKNCTATHPVEPKVSS